MTAKLKSAGDKHKQGKCLYKLLISILIGLLFLAGCDKPAKTAVTAADIPSATTAQKPKVITFVTMNSPNTYFVNDDNEYAGLEYDLAKLFVKDLNSDPQFKGAQLKLIVENHIDQILPAVLSGKADIAAADLSITEVRKKRFNFTTPYEDVQQQVVYNKDTGKTPPKNIKDLIGLPIVVPSGTSFAERLAKLHEHTPNLTWQERVDANSE